MIKILEKFNGWITKIEDQSIFLDFETPDGKEKFWGECDSSCIENPKEGQRITITTIETNGEVDVVIEKIPLKELTAEDYSRIESMIESMVGNENDY